MLIAAAILGWVLFLFVLILYRIGNRINAQENNALAVFALALMLSDEWRDLNRKNCEGALRSRGESLDLNATMYASMEGITKGAKDLESENLAIVIKEMKPYFS